MSHISISQEEKLGVEEEISLSSVENNRARPPPRLGVGLLASSNVKPLGVNLDAKAESSFVSQVSVIADMEQLMSMIN